MSIKTLAYINKHQITMKTSVLLAFGKHSSRESPANKKFFRRAIVPFLEEHVERRGKKATIVHENAVYDAFDDEIAEKVTKKKLKAQEEPTEENVRSFREFLSSLERTFDEMYKTMIKYYEFANTGREEPPLDSSEFFETLGGLPYDQSWGFEDYVLKVNRTSPYSIVNICEKPNVEAALTSWHVRTIKSGARPSRFADHLVDTVRFEVMQMHARDAALVAQMEEIAKTDPESVIVVPRGLMHKPMIQLIDKEKFDFTVHYKGMLIKSIQEYHFLSTCKKYYAKEIDDEGLRKVSERTARIVSAPMLLRAIVTVVAKRIKEHMKTNDA